MPDITTQFYVTVDPSDSKYFPTTEISLVGVKENRVCTKVTRCREILLTFLNSYGKTQERIEFVNNFFGKEIKTKVVVTYPVYEKRFNEIVKLLETVHFIYLPDYTFEYSSGWLTFSTEHISNKLKYLINLIILFCRLDSIESKDKIYKSVWAWPYYGKVTKFLLTHFLSFWFADPEFTYYPETSGPSDLMQKHLQDGKYKYSVELVKEHAEYLRNLGIDLSLKENEGYYFLSKIEYVSLQDVLKEE
jgi:hypothetical protein